MDGNHRRRRQAKPDPAMPPVLTGGCLLCGSFPAAKNEIIDFHTHAFSDDLAPKAIKVISDGCPDLSYHLNGTVSDLLKSMDEVGISRSVICSIATKPKQFAPVFDWSLEIQSDRIIPLASVHPKDEQRDEHIKQVKDAGLKGLKLHPYYQDFYVDEDNMLKILRAGLQKRPYPYNAHRLRCRVSTYQEGGACEDTQCFKTFSATQTCNHPSRSLANVG